METTVALQIALATGATVISLDYRLAPEHPFPAAPDDIIASWRWIVDHPSELGMDPARIAIAGDSAGGNLSAVLCLDARDQGLRAARRRGPPDRRRGLGLRP